MKKYIFLLALSFSFFISHSQNENVDLQESYILTKNGEKILIVANEGLYNSIKKVNYCSSKMFDKTTYLKKDSEKKYR